MAFGFSGGSAENIRPRPPLREDFAVIREEPNLRIAFSGDPEEEYEVERVDADGSATVVGSSSSPDILVPSQSQEHRVVAKNSELGIRGTPSVPKKELKPTHRWQMPQPRNLLDDPESFDPGSTDWNFSNNTTYSTADNVGPSGETAAHLDRSAENNDGFFIIDKSISYIPNSSFTAGIFVRAVSGSGEIKFDFTTDAGVTAAVSPTITTEWEWITVSAPPADSATEVNQVRIYDPGVREIYILRAVLNRGSSRLFSTRSEVPQEIPDVVQGADLSNGSTDSADTNDLDFGVDSQGVPYAVSGGDDRTEEIPSSALGGTWAARIYLALGSRVNIYLGDRNSGRWDIVHVPGQSRLLVRLNDVDGNSYFAVIDTGLNEPGWNTVVATLDESTNTIRFNVNGNTTSVTTTADFKDQTFPLLNVGVTSGRVQHVEKHPVLTPAEAEAVRQRLAQNPSDPVPVTEAWDFSAETSPHNLIKYSEDFSSWGIAKSSAAVSTDIAVAPNGSTTADKITDSNSNDFAGVRSLQSNIPHGETCTGFVWLKKDANSPIAGISIEDNIDKVAQVDPADGTIDLSDNFSGSHNIDRRGNGKIKTIKYSTSWWLIVVKRDIVNNKDVAGGKMALFPAAASTLGTWEVSAEGSNVFWGAQVVRGDAYDSLPPYAPTNGSIAFPQTVPALRDSSNDLTLGSSSGADTNDPDWVAPVGVVTDGDDRLDVPPETLTQEATWTHAFRQIGSKLQFRVGPVKLKDKFNINIAIQDVNGSLYTLSSSGVIFDDNKHVYTLVYSEAKRIVRLYFDGSIVIDVDLDADTSLGPLDLDAYTNFLDFSAGAAVHENLIHYSRVLTPEEIAYDAERLLDNPETAFPNYTTP